MNDCTRVIEALEFLKEDPMTIKRVKDRADSIISLLQENSEVNLNRALRALEEMDSTEIPAYDRAQIWDIVSLLESITLAKV